MRGFDHNFPSLPPDAPAPTSGLTRTLPLIAVNLFQFLHLEIEPRLLDVVDIPPAEVEPVRRVRGGVDEAHGPGGVAGRDEDRVVIGARILGRRHGLVVEQLDTFFLSLELGAAATDLAAGVVRGDAAIDARGERGKGPGGEGVGTGKTAKSPGKDTEFVVVFLLLFYDSCNEGV